MSRGGVSAAIGFVDRFTKGLGSSELFDRQTESNDNRPSVDHRAALVGTTISRLTVAQRECLRLVLAHYSSKEIAQQLGIGPSAVDKRIERAVETLGARSRFDAARLLAAAERDVPLPGATDEPKPFALAMEMPGFIENSSRASSSGLSSSGRVTWSGPARMTLVVGLVMALCVSMLVVLTVAEQGSHLLRQHGF